MRFVTFSKKINSLINRKELRNKSARKEESIINSIKDSGLFSEEWYISANPDVSISSTPIEHYFSNGVKEGRTPSYLFDPKWYLIQNPDVKSSGIGPLEHYIKFGEKEGRKPSLYFDPQYYKAKYNLSENVSPLRHYYENATTKNLNPLPEFDAKYYRDVHSDVSSAGIDPYKHFIFQGLFEGRNPSPDFDINWYINTYLTNEENTHAFYHYLTEGKKKGYDTKPGIKNSLKKISYTSSVDSENNTNFLSPGAGFEDFKYGDRLSDPDVKIIAYYLPQFHPFEENNEWWGTGFTEWTNVTRGRSRFKGHYQPHLPRDLGFYDLRLKETLVQQANMARNAGLEGFCFYHYWFNGKRLMDSPVNMLLDNPEINLPFCIMWANENWSRRWDGLDHDILIAQDYRDEDDEAFIADIARHFNDPRYIRIDGKPIFFIYRPSIVPNAKEKFTTWRKLLKLQHDLEIVFYMVQAFDDLDPRRYGLDGAIEFPPHKVAAGLPSVAVSQGLIDPEFTGHYPSYDAMIERSLDDCCFDFDVIKAVTPMWDNEARKPGRGMGFVGATPQSYEYWLSSVISYAKANPIQGKHKFVAVNAWNEWAEGAHLEPDLYWGSAYLNATYRAAYDIKPVENKYSVILVGHDAYKHGAQLLMLNIFKTLREQFGCDAHLIILGEGPLIEEYEKIGPTYTCYNDLSRFEKIIKQLKDKHGGCRAITNTTVSGKAAELLYENGYDFISLIHELENLIREYQLESSVNDISKFAKRIIFAANAVQNSFINIADVISSEKLIIHPQGIYQPVVYNQTAYLTVRNELNIPADAKIIINAGYADLRKGFDLFINLAKELTQRDPSFHFVWIGDIEQSLKHWYKSDIESSLLIDHFHNIPFTNEICKYLSAADLFAITSREDPFPSVVMEALAIGIPVVGFENSGGFTELLEDPLNGSSVPMANTHAMATEIIYQIQHDSASIKTRRSETAKEKFCWDDYVFSLLEYLDPALKKVSVSIPNYNYEKYLTSRLHSVFSQHYPVFEIIVLDDNSSDNSLEVINNIANSYQRKLNIIVNETNSGSVFKQWKKGADAARGKYIWIAEADDLAEPEFLSTILDGNTDFDLAYAESKQIDENDSHLADNYHYYYDADMLSVLEKPGIYSGQHIIHKCLSIKNQFMNVSSILFNRESLCASISEKFSAITSYKVAGDWYIYIDILSQPNSKSKIVKESLNTHRRHNNSVTRQNYSVQLNEIKSIHDITLKFGDEKINEMQSKYRKEIKKLLDTQL